MSYNAIAAAAQDADLKKRVAACFAQETTGVEQPTALAELHIWRIVANGPIADAYSYAVATNVPNPGTVTWAACWVTDDSWPTSLPGTAA